MRYSWMLMLGLLAAALPSMPANAETMGINLRLSDYHNPALLGDTAIISVWVEDNRAAPALGRELHGKAILPRQGVDMVLRNALVGSLRDAGFRVAQVPIPQSVDMVVHVTTLSYEAKDGFLSSEADLTCKVSVEIRHDNWHVERSLATQASHTVPLSPSEEKIGELVSETLTDILKAIMDDTQINAALRGEPKL